MIFQKFNIPFYKPFRIEFDVTSRCNLKCKNCCFWKCKGKSMSSVEGNKYITNLMNWIKYPFYLTFSGGEPLLIKQDLFKMIKFASTKGILTNVTSNGTLVNRFVKKSLIDSGLYSINISLESLDASIHDYMRGRKGTHKKVMKSISLLKKSRIKINIATILTAENCNTILELVDWVNEENFHNIAIQPLLPKIYSSSENKGWFKKTGSWPKNQKIMDIIDSLIQMKKKGYQLSNSIKHLTIMKDYYKNPIKNLYNASCMTGKNLLIIHPQGDLFFCRKYGAIGNLNNDTLKNIFKSDKPKYIKKEINNCKKPCLISNCNFEESILNNFLKFFAIKNKTIHKNLRT